MTLQMVDRDERLACAVGQCLGGHDTDDDTADQTGAGRDGDPVHRVKLDPGIAQRGSDDPVERFDMRARGDLGNDPAERFVFTDLAQHDVGQYTAGPVGFPFHDGS